MNSTPPEPDTIDIGTLDHAEFDRELVGAFGDRSAWTRPRQKTQTTMRQFYDHLHHQMIGVLKKREEYRPFKNQLASSPVVEFLTHEAFNKCAAVIHLRQGSTEEAVSYVQRFLQSALHDNALVTTDEQSPLWGRGTRSRASEERADWTINLRNPNYAKEYDLLKTLLGRGKKSRTEPTETFLRQLIAEANPFLLTLDRTHVDIIEEETRRQAWDIIGSKGALSDEDRQDLRYLFTSRLADLIGGLDFEKDLLDIEQEVHTSSVRLQYEHFTVGQLGAEIRKLGQHPPRVTDRESLLAIILRLLAERNVKKMPFAILDDQHPVEVVEQYIGPLLSKPALTDDDRATLLRRLPVLEYHLGTLGSTDAHYVDNPDGENKAVLKLLGICRDVREKLNLVWADRPSLTYAQFTCATRSPAIDVGVWKSNL